MGSKAGVMKVAAKRIGLSIEEYQENIDNGLKYCYACQSWNKKSKHGVDYSRGDGLTATCKPCRKKQAQKRPKRKQPKEQTRAHRLIQMRVLRGTMPKPDSLPCNDCGHIGDDRRHEYDHYLGYDGKNKERVQAVCSICHARRHKERRNG